MTLRSTTRFAAIATVLGVALATLVATPAAAAAPEILEQPVPPTGYPGEGLIVSIEVDSDIPYTVSWQIKVNFGSGQEWRQLATGDEAALFYPGSFPLDTKAVVSNNDGVVESNIFQPTFLEPVAPSITDQPEAVTVTEGEDATFTADAEGPPTPSVQWYQRVGGGDWTDIPGATNRTYTRTAVPLSDDDLQIRARFQNSAGTEYTGVVRLHVNPAPSAPEITKHPFDAVVYYEGGVYFTADADGVPAPTVQWEQSANGTDWEAIPGETSKELLLLDVLAPGYVRAVFSNASGNTPTDPAAITLREPGPPRIQFGPENVSVYSGDDATFTVEPMGLPVADIQWYMLPPGGDWDTDLIAVTGATGRELTFESVTLADNGTWVLAILTNEFGSEESWEAELEVLPVAPDVTLDPVDTYPHAGTAGAWVTTFTADAYADPPAAVSWERFDGSDWVTIPDADEKTLTITAPAGTEVRARFENFADYDYTDSATVLDPDVPTIDWVSTETDIFPGATASFEVSVTGGPDPTITWQQFEGGEWTDLPGANGTTFETVALQYGESLTIRATVSTVWGSDETAAFTVEVAPQLPEITLQPVDAYPDIDGGYTFTAEATGIPAPTIQWYVKILGLWNPLPDLVEDGTTLPPTTAVTTGTELRAVFTNAAGSVESTTVQALPATAPTIEWVSAASVVDSGESATFEVSTTGMPSPAVTWQWYDGSDWATIAGETGSSYTTGPLEWADSGITIRAVATNFGGTAETTAQSVAVQPIPPAVAVQPTDVSVTEGGDAVFTITVTGDPVSIQWQTAPAGTSDWSDVPGATGPTFTIPEVQLTDDGLQVRAIITGDDGLTLTSGELGLAALVQLTSDIATLSVTALPVEPGLAATGVEASTPLFAGLLLVLIGVLALGFRRRMS